MAGNEGLYAEKYSHASCYSNRNLFYLHLVRGVWWLSSAGFQCRGVGLVLRTGAYKLPLANQLGYVKTYAMAVLIHAGGVFLVYTRAAGVSRPG